MKNIKSLQRDVSRSLRSGVVLFDLPRVVEELACNSVDSGATKVFVSINVRACYVKVEDDGCGITRDGLMIVGERYATSKSHLLADMENTSERIGFRGEALASLADVSLVEIRTKARRMPNAYCKIIKGSNCLFFGIDDQREVIGTTVVVRDLFYNQPVRRNCMQSSPKRVLHSLKKCVLRIALVHPQVLFKVTDTASEEELLCTIPSPSPVPLISDGFGEEVSSSLQEKVFSDQGLMLSGYVSGPSTVFSTKAFQYLYINSRFVTKGPIHNLVNNLAASFQLSFTCQKDGPELRSTKRQKIQGHPAFLFNFCCPLSSYDLHFEPSKTVVEFKDWDTVSSFFDRAIKHFWEQVADRPIQGNSFAYGNGMPVKNSSQEEDTFFAGLLESPRMRETKYNVKLDENILSHSSVTNLLETSFEEAHVKQGKSSEEIRKFSWLRPCQKKAGYLGHADWPSRYKMHDYLDDLDSLHAQLGSIKRSRGCSADIGSSFLENNLFEDMEDTHGISNRDCEASIPEDCSNTKRRASFALPNSDDHGAADENIHIPVHCFTAHEKMKMGKFDLFEYEEGHSVSCTDHSSFHARFDHLGQSSPLLENGDTLEADKLHLTRHNSFQEEDDNGSPLVTDTRGPQLKPGLDTSSIGSLSPFLWEEPSMCRKNKLRNELALEFSVADCKRRFPVMDWHLDTLQSLSVTTARTNTQRLDLAGDLPSVSSTGCRYPCIAAEHNPVWDTDDEIPATSYTKTKLEFWYGLSPTRNGYHASLSKKDKLDSSALFDDRISRSCSKSSNRLKDEIYEGSASQNSMQIQDEGRSCWVELNVESSCPPKVHKLRSRRSCSAPPFFKGKPRFASLNDKISTMEETDCSSCSSVRENAIKETTRSLNVASRPPSSSQPCLKPDVNEVSHSFLRKPDEKKSFGEVDEACYDQLSNTYSAEGSTADNPEYKLGTPTKWRTGALQPTVQLSGGGSHASQNDILSIFSGLLHFSASSLIPGSITKDHLDDARVLLQLDRKFIPVMAGNVLIVIDQHAADERIRLEELRQKVLSREANSITYLENVEELVLPEMGYQLLQKYAAQIEKWGWICNVHTQFAESFAKNVNLLKKQRCSITLAAVPCILGVNLNGRDLIEFIEQLTDTDGSSTIPPSVLRILNFKACRGAIMFGDSLMPSECSLIVEELKATSLCFQCAHGRPTTVPLLNVASLRGQLAVLEAGNERASPTWHGLLHQHTISFQRAKQRLESADRFQGG